MEIDESPTFAELLRRARSEAGLTQEALAERANTSVRGISDLERGIHPTPRRDTLDLLATALELPDDERRIWERARSSTAIRARSSWTELQAPPGNLPQPLTAIYGRDDQISALTDLLQQSTVRLVTVTGTGGVGKTRLALAVGHAVRKKYPDGIWFVSLAPVSDRELVLPSIATTLEIPVPTGQAIPQALSNALLNKRALLILDNFEQVVSAAPYLVKLLEDCLHLAVLTTSRVPLLLAGEQEYPLDPLWLPEDSAAIDPERFDEYPAVELFIARARSVNPDFSWTGGNARAVVSICRRLDCLPLAIELAAARIRLLTLQAMLKRLDHRLALLRSDARDIPDRHRTLRDTIGWSYDLLQPDQQRLFRTLSVFRGGWTLDTAESLLARAGSPGEAATVLDGLETLIANNLVQLREQAGGEPRYFMLETIREFGLEQLDAAGEKESARKAHLSWCIDLAEIIFDETHGSEQSAWLNRGDDEHNNVRAALQWSLEHEPTEALRLSRAMSEYWLFRGILDEGRYWLDASWERATNPPDSIRASGLLFRGEFRYWMGDYEPANQMVDESITLYRALGDRFGLGLALYCRGRGAWFQGDFDQAYEAADESLRVFIEINNTWGIAGAYGHLGVITHRQGKLDEARDYLEHALAIDRNQNDLIGVVVWLSNLGDIAVDAGDYDLARERHREALEINREIKHARMILRSIEGMAAVVGIDGRREQAARLFGAASHHREQTHIPLSSEEIADFQRRLDLARFGADEASWAAAWESGHDLSLDEAIDLALTAGKAISSSDQKSV